MNTDNPSGAIDLPALGGLFLSLAALDRECLLWCGSTCADRRHRAEKKRLLRRVRRVADHAPRE